MHRLLVGLFGFPFRNPKQYGNHLPAIELQETFAASPRGATLESWNTSVGKGFEFVVKCNRDVTHPADEPQLAAQTGLFRDTPQVEAAWFSTLENARKLGAKTIMLETPAGFTPVDRNISQMLDLLEKTPWGTPHDFTVAWQARGVWSRQALKEVCNNGKVRLVACVDPLKEKPLKGEVAYGHLYTYWGSRSGFDLETSLEAVEKLFSKGAERAYLFYGNPNAMKDARALMDALQDEDMVDDLETGLGGKLVVGGEGWKTKE